MIAGRAAGVAAVVVASVVVGCSTKPAPADSAASGDTTASMAPPALSADTSGVAAARLDSAPVSVAAPSKAPAVAKPAARTPAAAAAGTARAPGGVIGRDSTIEFPKGGPVRTLPEVPRKPPR